MKDRHQVLILGDVSGSSMAMLNEVFEIVLHVDELKESDPFLFKGFDDGLGKVSRGKGKKYKQWDKR